MYMYVYHAQEAMLSRGERERRNGALEVQKRSTAGEAQSKGQSSATCMV